MLPIRKRDEIVAASPVNGLAVPKACACTRWPSLARATETVRSPRPNSDWRTLASNAANALPGASAWATATAVVGAKDGVVVAPAAPAEALSPVGAVTAEEEVVVRWIGR